MRDIRTAEQFIGVAATNGFAMEEHEADTILSYMEGHGYAIMADEKGTTYRFDMDSGRPYDEEEPEYYTLREFVDFCINANEELANDPAVPYGATLESYLEELKEDSAVLDGISSRLG